MSPEESRLLAKNKRLLSALERIAAHEDRADRRHRGMVDAEEVETCRRIARTAIAEAEAGFSDYPASRKASDEQPGRKDVSPI